jgi:hypothetical protein
MESILAIVAVWNWALGRTMRVGGEGIKSSRPSVLRKKKSLSFLNGPPNEAAHW